MVTDQQLAQDATHTAIVNAFSELKQANFPSNIIEFNSVSVRLDRLTNGRGYKASARLSTKLVFHGSFSHMDKFQVE